MNPKDQLLKIALKHKGKDRIKHLEKFRITLIKQQDLINLQIEHLKKIIEYEQKLYFEDLQKRLNEACQNSIASHTMRLSLQ